MKVAISLSDELFARADEAAARAGVNRSQFYARALEELLQGQREDPVTTRLDELADTVPAGPAGVDHARRLVDTGAWEW